MKIERVLFLLFLLFSSFSSYSQELKVKLSAEGKIGFVDKNGVEVIPCEYENATPFENGVTIVTKKGKCGIVDVSGKILLPLKYTQIKLWHDSLYVVESGKKKGISTCRGEILLEPKYSHISKLNSYGRALISIGGKEISQENKKYLLKAKYGVIDDNAQILISPEYTGLYEFSHDVQNLFPYFEGKRLQYSYHYLSDTLLTDCSYMGFSKNSFNIFKSGIIDGHGNIIVPAKIYDYVMKPSGGMVRYYKTKKKETICGYYNIEDGSSFDAAIFSNSISDLNIWTHGDFIGDIAPVNGETWKFINKKGEILRTDYSKIKHCNYTHLWAAEKDSKWYVFDESNADITKLSGYEQIFFPQTPNSEEVFSVKKDVAFGCVNRNGEILVPFEYTHLTGNSFGFLCASKGDKWGITGINGEIIVPIEFVDVIKPSEPDTKHFWVKKTDSLFYHFAHEGDSITRKVGYKRVSNFIDGVALVQAVDMEISESMINKAQLFQPNTSTDEISAVDVKAKSEEFGFLIDTSDSILINLPVSQLYIGNVISKIKEKGSKLTLSEQKKIMLDVTKENRSYELKSIIDDESWDF